MRRQYAVYIGGVMMVGFLLTACAAQPAASPTAVVARPSHSGDPGPAATMIGDAKNGAVIFAGSCQVCHGDTGKGGVNNPGSKDGTVPALNPIDDTLINKDPKIYAYNLDLFIQHGSDPEPDKAGAVPTFKMNGWGDDKALTQQQIADVIAYVMSLNPPK